MDVTYLKLSSAYEKETYSWNKQNNQYKGTIYTKQKPPSLFLLNHSWQMDIKRPIKASQLLH